MYKLVNEIIQKSYFYIYVIDIKIKKDVNDKQNSKDD